MTNNKPVLKINQIEIAKKFGTTVGYVHQISKGIRKPTKGKGLKIKQFIDSLLKEIDIKETK